MSGHTGSSVGSPTQAPGSEQPAFSAPTATPQQGSLCSWGVLGLVTSSWALVAKEAETKRGVQMDTSEQRFESGQKGGFVDTAWREEIVPAQLRPCLAAGRRASACPSLSFRDLICKGRVSVLRLPAWGFPASDSNNRNAETRTERWHIQ